MFEHREAESASSLFGPGLSRVLPEELRDGIDGLHAAAVPAAAGVANAGTRDHDYALHYVDQVDPNTRGHAAPPQKKPMPGLLRDFAKDFPEAAKLISDDEAAMKLVEQAAEAGVQYYSNLETERANTVSKSVSVPGARKDPFVAMSDFLFELNNGLRSDNFDAIHKAAQDDGARGVAPGHAEYDFLANDYARKTLQQEVAGTVRTGEVWAHMKSELLKKAKPAERVKLAHQLDGYDDSFFLNQYVQAQQLAKKGQPWDEIIEDMTEEMLDAPYEDGSTGYKNARETYRAHYEGWRKTGAPKR